MNTKPLFLILFLLIVSKAFSQQAIPVTDAQPVVVNGLNIGYNIKSVEVKKVGDKGDFSRYAMRFYVTNVDNFPKIIHYRPGYPNGEGISARLAQFNILNATGYRLTSNVAYINADVFNKEVPDDRPNHDPHRERRLIQVGYWIQAGQTISTDEIVITPLNQQPNVEVIFQGNLLQAEGYVVDNRPPPPPPAYAMQNQGPPPPPPSNSALFYDGFLKFENKREHTYLNNQTGAPACTPIQPGWWSSEWRLESVPGSNFVHIKNRWTQAYLDVDRGYVVLSPGNRSHGSEWIFEPTYESNVFRIKNIMTGTYLCVQNQQLTLSNDFHDEHGLSWSLQQQ